MWNAQFDRQTDRQTDRQSNIELLRIIAMIMIAFHHFACHGNFDWQSVGATIPHLWYNFIVMGGKIGVDIFILISGYFLINSNGSVFNFKRILKFWGQVFFYSIGIYIVFCAVGVSDFGIKSLIKSLFPITFSSWWFASTYFVLYIIHSIEIKCCRYTVCTGGKRSSGLLNKTSGICSAADCKCTRIIYNT